jgi:2'-hydroxybiphenyl-2-sulfinate desulfinase
MKRGRAILSRKIDEFRYTICPVGNASYISANKGFLQSGLEKYGVKATRLQTLPFDRWDVHFNYEDDALFREGGNIPPIWAKSRGAEPVLIALSFLEQGAYILARLDSPVNSAGQLRGRRLGLPVDSRRIIDFYAATVHHGFKTALEAKGVALDEVEFVKTKESPIHEEWEGQIGLSAIEALNSGDVDAVFADLTQAQRLLNTGKYKIVRDLHANTDVLLPINNCYPNVLTVSKKLAADAPEIVVEYVKQALLAAEWAKTNLPEVIELFGRQMAATPGEVVNIHTPGFHLRLAPTLDDKGLQALEGQKRYLLDSGYIENDFDISSWADGSFLKAALKELDAENLKSA